MSAAAQRNLDTDVQIDRQPDIQPVNPIGSGVDEPALPSPQTLQTFALSARNDRSRTAVSSVELSQEQVKRKYPRYDNNFNGTGDSSTFIKMFEISVILQQ